MTAERTAPTVLIVIPCLNEAGFIRGLLDRLHPSAMRLAACIAVVDGGSVDGTATIVERYARDHQHVVLIDNPKRIQSAAVNLAVEKLGQDFEYLIRIDAHGEYPEDYCDRLIDEAVATGADSVVVSMVTSGKGIVQSATAAVQNSKLGTGGSHHRHLDQGRWVDHGHHALMRIAAFRAVEGYDETFRHNEDAELDYRLGQAGFRIWLTNRTHMIYFPRSTLGKLYVQYLGYGRGRARNVVKHRVVPKLRQLIPLSVFPVVVAGSAGLIHLMIYGPKLWNLPLVLPAAVWLAACAAFGLRLGLKAGDPKMSVASVSAAVMHFAWSLGFWLQLAAFATGSGKALR
jgi:succinoglycan biosynthesis protein ExoA